MLPSPGPNGEALPFLVCLLIQDEAIMSALYNTLVIALISALLATLLGTAASIGISAMKPRAKTVFMGSYQHSHTEL